MEGPIFTHGQYSKQNPVGNAGINTGIYYGILFLYFITLLSYRKRQEGHYTGAFDGARYLLLVFSAEVCFSSRQYSCLLRHKVPQKFCVL